jgi:ABC-type Mn2+/Zn2+ transport system permease subunit
VVARRAGIRQDTAIGVLFAGMFAFGIFLYSGIHGYVADLFSFLLGNVLAIGLTDLIALTVLGVGVVVVVAVLWKELLYATFDPLGAAASGIRVDRLELLFLALVAITIVVSLQAVGIILVVAMLVTPAATAQLLTVRFTRLMLTAAAVGIGSAIAGLYISYWLDVASGATIVLVQTALFALALVLGPRGLIARRRGKVSDQQGDDDDDRATVITTVAPAG